MKTDSIIMEWKNNGSIIMWARDKQNLVSVLPYVVSVENDNLKLRFTRALFFSFESKFNIRLDYFNDKLVEYKLTDEKGNLFELRFLIEGKNKLRISITYSGEKEWIVGNALRKILDEIKRGIEKEASKYEVQPQFEDYSHRLAKISYLTKLITKSKLVDTEEISVPKGGLVDYLQQIVSQYAHYPVIYVSGTGSATFRVLLMNGDLKGVYVLDADKEYFGDEEELNKLSGNFKINIYVMISPRVLEMLQ